LLFSKVSVCLNCGFLRGIVPASELALLTKSSPKSECSTAFVSCWPSPRCD
jgi:hypothetical protein